MSGERNQKTATMQVIIIAITIFAARGNSMRVRRYDPVRGQSADSVAMKLTTAPATNALASY